MLNVIKPLDKDVFDTIEKENKLKGFSFDLIKTGCLILMNLKLIKYLGITDPRRIMVVYNLRKINGKYLPLNRNYQPIGVCTKSYVIYEDYPNLLLDKKDINFKPIKDSQDGEYMFDDLTSPFYETYKDKRNITRYLDLCEKMFRINLGDYK